MWKILLFLLLIAIVMFLLVRPPRNRPPRGGDDDGGAPLRPMLSADGSDRRGEASTGAEGEGKAEPVLANGSDDDDGGD